MSQLKPYETSFFLMNVILSPCLFFGFTRGLLTFFFPTRMMCEVTVLFKVTVFSVRGATSVRLIMICRVAQAGHSTGHGAQPASCTMGTASLPGVK